MRADTPAHDAAAIAALPDDWNYWLKDAASLLRESGNTMHADKVSAVRASLAQSKGEE